MTSRQVKRILILRNSLVLNSGVQSLLSKQRAFDVIGMEVHTRKELFKTIDDFKPDVIIVDDEYLVKNLAALLRFLQKYPKTRTIILSLKGNTIQIYDTQQIQIENISDFLSVI